MTKRFIYTVLQYHHSIVLGEIMNVGILMIFPDQNHTAFLSPKTLERVKIAYPNMTSDLITEAYIKSFEELCYEYNDCPDCLSKKLRNLDDWSIRQFIQTFLPDNPNALQFSEHRVVLQYTDNIESIKKQFEERYFGFFQ